MIIGTVAQAAQMLAPFFAAGEGETLAVIHLDRQQRLLGLTLDRGGPDSIELPVREILAKAVAIGAAAIILAHNHPSGDCTPSAADEAATRALARAAAGLDIRLQDHLVLGDRRVESFRRLGLL